MIKFKNINGDVFLAVGSVKRKSALNGEKSLSATITQGDDVLNRIDKGWSLEFDNEPYVVTYFERNDNNNTVEIDAIHKFFWDMTKSVLYNSYSNSHVARFYLDEIFKDTGYTYALNFDPKAFEKENWGMKNKLSLFNDAISSMGAEFEINGTLISIFKNVGSDLSTIVRHGFNLSDMTLENDNANFATYGEGFGAYDDKENQKGPRLHVTYTGPLAKAFGKLHAEPIVDERYTVKDNLLSAVKDKVDSSFAVSVKLSLYDLTAAGYPYKMANVGDWLLAVDEHLDFKQKIRIISVDDEFAEDGTRISYTVTCGDVGVTKKYQDANAALTQKVQSAYENAQTAKDAAIQAVISATGKNTIYDNIDGEENLPKTANEGDLAFVQTGDGKAMYIYTKMPDGSFKWVKRLDPDTGEQIAAGVEEAIATANKHTDELNEKQASKAAVFQSEANAALSSAAAERTVFSSNAASMATSAAAHADSMADSASAYANVQASNALSQAQSELATAKQELGSEVSKAQSDIVATNNELAGKVSQSDFDKATGDLTTKYGQVKATADAVTTEVSNYKVANDKKVSANTASINTLNNQITSKVSQTDFDKTTGDLSGKYSVQQQTINGISQTVTELQAKANAQGQVNQLMNTEFNPDLEGWITDSVGRAPYRSYFDTTVNKVTVGFNTQNNDIAVSMLSQKVALASTPGARGTISLSWQARSTDGSTGTQTVSMSFVDSSGNTIGKSITADWTDRGTGWNIKKIEGINIPDKATSVTVAFIVSEKVTAYLSKPMLVFDATIGDYVAGNYNNNNRVAALELGIDHITGLVNDPKNGLSATAALAANGMVVATSAQNDATTAIQTAKGTQITVSSVQKNIKDLQSTTTQTADQVTKEIQDRKNGDSASETLLKNLIEQRVNDVTTGYTGAIQTMANGIYASVSMPNKLVNTEFAPDLEGWTISNPLSGTGNGATIYTSNGYGSSNGLRINAYTNNSASADAYYQVQQSVKVPDNVSVASFRVMGYIYAISDNDNAYINANVAAIDSAGGKIGSVVGGTTLFNKATMSSWQESSSRFINMSIPDGTDRLQISIYARGQTSVNISQPMLVFNSTVGNYQVGSYNNMGTSTVLQLFKDNWGIGLADNVGKITSGIIGDKNSLNLINNNIVLQGNTTVTADFYAKGGNFKNLNASNITTGTINAAKINVINLDVSSLSGNITNFIKSYWSDAYSNQVVVNANNVSFYTNSHRSSTVISEGQIDMTVYNNTTKIPEHIGGLKHGTVVGRDNQDYLIMYLDGWKTQGGHPADAAKHGGDGFMFSVSDGWNIPTGMPLLTWENELLAGGAKHLPGWHFWDHTEFHSDVMMFPNGAYQGLYFGATEYNGTTYPGIFGNQKQDDGPGILFGSTELYFLYKNTVYPLSVVLKAASGGW